VIKDYLDKILSYPPFRDHPRVLDLINVSPFSFITELGPSIFEGRVKKRTGDNVYYGNFLNYRFYCDTAKIFYKKRWFIVKDSCIIYFNAKKNWTVGYVMLADRNFEVKMKHRPGAYYAVFIKNSQRTIVLKCYDSNHQLNWYEKLIYMMHGGGKQFWDRGALTYDSFAPSRSNQMCKWYVNAAQYMEHVMHALNSAREEIYITDWWIVPELYLIRPKNDLQYRLDKILLKKANEGVKIYILIFKEVTLAVNLLSSRAKTVLTQNGKNPNIKVLRHPEHSPSGVMLWSHHEKMVVIDQSLAFMGGIDLCFGRWDDDLHRLVDLGRKKNISEIMDQNNENLQNSVSKILTK
jgi:phospholipase D1/2